MNEVIIYYDLKVILILKNILKAILFSRFHVFLTIFASLDILSWMINTDICYLQIDLSIDFFKSCCF